MTKGWIKLHRKFEDWEWYTDVPVKTLFLHLLLEANHEQQKWKGMDIEKGQCVVGRKELSEKTGLSEQQIRTALDKLKSTGEIATKATNRFTVVTVLKYTLYQASEEPHQPTDNQQITNKQPTDNQQITTNKNDKNVKNDKNERNKEYLTILSLFKETCPSFPQPKSLSENRKKAINARLKKYTIEDFKTLFEKAEASDFLKGNNNRNWSANFDWLIRDTNMPKVLEGNYDNKARKENKSDDNWNFSDFIYGGSD